MSYRLLHPHLPFPTHYWSKSNLSRSAYCKDQRGRRWNEGATRKMALENYNLEKRQSYLVSGIWKQ